MRLSGGGGDVADRLVVDLGVDGVAGVLAWPGGGAVPEGVSQAPLVWPLDGDALEDLRWYLEDYLLAPFGVWEERGPAVAGKLAGWGEEVFGSVFGPARPGLRMSGRGTGTWSWCSGPRIPACWGCRGS